MPKVAASNLLNRMNTNIAVASVLYSRCIRDKILNEAAADFWLYDVNFDIQQLTNIDDMNLLMRLFTQ